MPKRLYVGYNPFASELFLNSKGKRDSGRDVEFRRIGYEGHFPDLVRYLIEKYGHRKNITLTIDFPEDARKAAEDLEHLITRANQKKQLKKMKVQYL